MIKVERTLMKSPPELWEMVDDETLMRDWSAELAGVRGEVEVTKREDEEVLAWRPAHSDGCGLIELKLEKKGWGTRLKIKIEPCNGATERVQDVLERILDDFNSAHKRPFTKV